MSNSSPKFEFCFDETKVVHVIKFKKIFLFRGLTFGPVSLRTSAENLSKAIKYSEFIYYYLVDPR